jgi:hypothetical protein
MKAGKNFKMNNIKDFIDFHAENAGMTREEYTAYYLSEKKEPKLTYLWLTYNDRGGNLYKATFKYSNGDEFKLRPDAIDEIESRIKDAYGIDVKAGNLNGATASEDELYKLSKKLKIKFTIYEHDLS